MRTVPVTVAEIAVAAGIADAATFAPCGRQVGDRVEIDLDTLSDTTPAVADWADRYWAAAQELWSAWADRKVSGDVLAVRRDLVQAVQVDSKQAGRRDLRAELDALGQYAGFRPLLDALLAPEPSHDEVQASLRPWKHQIAVDGNRVTVTVWTTEPVAWPGTLGGAAAPGEIARVFTLVAQHAAWRDRKVRRLAEVRVETEELWPTAGTGPRHTAP